MGVLDKLSHYALIAFLLAVPVLFLFSTIFRGTVRLSYRDEFIVTFGFALVAFFFYKLQKNRLRFKSVNTRLSREDVEALIEEVGKKLEWQPYLIKKDVYLLKTHPGFFSPSWGEQITILFDKNKVLINSICDLSKRSSVASFGRNKRNMNELIKRIKEANRQKSNRLYK